MELQLTLQYAGVPIKGPTFLLGDKESVVKSSMIPDSRLGKQTMDYCTTLQGKLLQQRLYFFIASPVSSFHHILSELNPADILSNYWVHLQVSTTLQPLLFWSGDTGKLIEGANVVAKTEGALVTNAGDDGDMSTHLGSTKVEL
jgi:hypothetical protein